MEADKVGFLPPRDAFAIPAGQGAVKQGSADFATWLSDQVKGVDAQIAESDRKLSQMAAGQVDNVHQVMIALEEARTSFQLLMQIRNRILEAYQDILRMQV